MPKLKSKRKAKRGGEGLAGDTSRVKRNNEYKIRNASQSAGLTPALNPRKLCLVTILPGTGEQPGVFLRSCQLSDKLRCVVKSRSEAQGRLTWQRGEELFPSSSGALLQFRCGGAAEVEWCSAGTGFTLMCTCCCRAPRAPKQAVHCSSVCLYPCPGGRWSSCIHRSPAI